MDITSRFRDMKSYIIEVTEILWRYIQNTDSYPRNALLAIQPELLTTVIDTRDACSQCEYYALNQLLKRTNHGTLVPNDSAIERLAMRYFRP